MNRAKGPDGKFVSVKALLKKVSDFRLAVLTLQDETRSSRRALAEEKANVCRGLDQIGALGRRYAALRDISDARYSEIGTLKDALVVRDNQLADLNGRLERTETDLASWKLSADIDVGRIAVLNKHLESETDRYAKELAEAKNNVETAMHLLKEEYAEKARLKTAIVEVYKSRLFWFFRPKLLRKVEEALYTKAPVAAPIVKVDKKPEAGKASGTAVVSEIKR